MWPALRGSRLTGGYDTNLLLGIYEGPRGAQVPTEFSVLVYQPGLYPVRLLHYAGGGAAVEFYTANNANAASTSGRVCVNGVDDSTTTVPVPAYSIVRPTLNIVQNSSQIVVSWYGGRQLPTEAKRPTETDFVGACQSSQFGGARFVEHRDPDKAFERHVLSPGAAIGSPVPMLAWCAPPASAK